MHLPRQCPQCQARFPADQTFCNQDGARLADAPTEAPADPRAGETIAGRFVLERRIGQGAMGSVYLAIHKTLERPFAVKIMLRELVHDATARERFFREARAASAVNHENIISLYDCGFSAEGEPYLAMEFVDGESLFAAIARSPQGLPPAQALDLAVQVARALHHAHERGIIHRDIKLENVLLCVRDGQPDFVKVLDFGVARIVGLPPLTQAGQTAPGTLQYMAPEMFTGEASFPVDLYALGVLLHELLAGSPPFDGELAQVLHGHLHTVPPLLSQRRPGLSTSLDELAARLLAKDPARRPTAGEAVTALEQARARLPPRSLSSLMVAQTMILSGQRAEVGTVVLPAGPANLAGTVILSSSQKQTVIKRPDAAATVLLTGLMEEIDALEQEIERTAAPLRERLRVLGRKLLPAGWPEGAHLVSQRLLQRAQEEDDLGMRLALLSEQVEEGRRIAEQRKEHVRGQILTLSERLQLDTGLGERERRLLQQALQDKEREFQRVAQEAGPAPVGEIEQVQRRMQELRREMNQDILLLGQALLGAPCPPALQGERDHLEGLMAQLEGALNLLDLHLGRGRRRSTG